MPVPDSAIVDDVFHVKQRESSRPTLTNASHPPRPAPKMHDHSAEPNHDCRLPTADCRLPTADYRLCEHCPPSVPLPARCPSEANPTIGHATHTAGLPRATIDVGERCHCATNPAALQTCGAPAVLCPRPCTTTLACRSREAPSVGCSPLAHTSSRRGHSTSIGTSSTRARPALTPKGRDRSHAEFPSERADARTVAEILAAGNRQCVPHTDVRTAPQQRPSTAGTLRRLAQ